MCSDPRGAARSALELIWKMHRFLYRASGGRIGARLGPWQVLLLSTRGRRTGSPHSVALNYLEDGDRVVVIASNAGEDRHPAWFLNLSALPDAEVALGAERRRVRARRVSGDERERLWRRVVALDPSYAVYQRRTSREIPVLVLEPP